METATIKQEVKELDKYTQFVNKGCVYYNKSNYKYLTWRNKYITFMIIYLLKHYPHKSYMTIKKLQDGINSHLKKIVKLCKGQHNNELKRIIDSGYQFMILKHKGKIKYWDEVPRSTLSKLLQILSPTFLNIRDRGNAFLKSQNINKYVEVELNNRGNQLYELIRNTEDYDIVINNPIKFHMGNNKEIKEE